MAEAKGAWFSTLFGIGSNIYGAIRADEQQRKQREFAKQQELSQVDTQYEDMQAAMTQKNMMTSGVETTSASTMSQSYSKARQNIYKRYAY